MKTCAMNNNQKNKTYYSIVPMQVYICPYLLYEDPDNSRKV